MLNHYEKYIITDLRYYIDNRVDEVHVGSPVRVMHALGLQKVGRHRRLSNKQIIYLFLF